MGPVGGSGDDDRQADLLLQRDRMVLQCRRWRKGRGERTLTQTNQAKGKVRRDL